MGPGSTAIATTFTPLPRKGTETKSLQTLDGPLCYSFTPLPRKGTETWVLRLLFPCLRPLSRHYPARGRKHRLSYTDHRILPAGRLSRHYPARGRKLVTSDNRSMCIGDNLSRHYPARGRKQFFSSPARCLSLNSSAFTPLPRKGTETCCPPADCQWVAAVRQLSRHYPARGRKQSSAIRSRLTTANFHAITPQGDGNAKAAPAPPAHPKLPFTPLPRKGTETSPPGNQNIGQYLFLSRHYPARGRKLYQNLIS